jgi:hypothetical protein
MERRQILENITIPAMGGDTVPNTTKVEEVADWIEERDKLPLLLAVSLYSSPILEYDGFKLIQDLSSSERVKCWYRESEDEWIIGCRGTAVLSNDSDKDLKDDIKIGFGEYCDLSIVQDARPIIQSILDEGWTRDGMIVCGHSLGGAAAMCLSAQFGIRGISLNGGASPTNPVTSGPGPMLFTHYHVFGDLISSHMASAACRVVRVKGEKTEFGTFYPHAAVRMLKRDGPKVMVTASQEDEAYLAWARKYVGGFHIFGALFSLGVYLANMKKLDIAKKSPIPDSARYEQMKLNGQLGK